MRRTGFSPEQVACSVAECSKPLVARGFCKTHWARWRRTGTPEGRKTYETCQADGCDRNPRSRSAQYCETHYYRLRRTGTVGNRKTVSGNCAADDCKAPASCNRAAIDERQQFLCRRHYLRLKKRGDMSFDGTWENHPRWTGEDATSNAVHQRLRAKRGRASSWCCTDCSGPAAHWSYNHSDPDEIPDAKGPYSLDPNHYFPRCARCHKLFDLADSRSRR